MLVTEVDLAVQRSAQGIQPQVFSRGGRSPGEGPAETTSPAVRMTRSYIDKFSVDDSIEYVEKLPKTIPPLSRVRLVRVDKRTPSWRRDMGRQFRVGYYSRKDGLDCIWLVNENGKYGQTTDRDFLKEYFQVEHVSREKNFYGIGKRRLGKIRLTGPMDRLNGRSSIDVFEAAKEIWEKDDPETLRSVIHTLRHGKRVVNRTAAAYALNLMRGKSAIPALEKSVDNRKEHPKVRGQAAESLAHSHRENSHRVLRKNLSDPSKEVRFWCAYALAEMSDGEALVQLRELAGQGSPDRKGILVGKQGGKGGDSQNSTRDAEQEGASFQTVPVLLVGKKEPLQRRNRRVQNAFVGGFRVQLRPKWGVLWGDFGEESQ